MKKRALENSQVEFEDVVPISIDVEEDPSDVLEDFFEEIVEDVDEWSDEVSETQEPKEIYFKLDLIPGAEDQSEFVEDEEEETVVEDEEATPTDPWDWESSGGTSKFLDWVQNMFNNIPKHSGRDTTGVERALSYFERLDKEISKAMKTDYKREIDAAKAEQAREEIEKGMERLLDRLERLKSKKFKRRKNKKADESYGLVKEAETTTTGRIVVTVPYLISNIARACIESTVQAGKDIEDCLTKLAEQYGLDKREKFQVVTLIRDMGYPVILDRLNFGDDAIMPSETKTSEFMTQYYA